MNFLLTDKEIFTLILTCSNESYSGLNPKVDSNIKNNFPNFESI
jgi:hypothetical protein